MYGYVSLCRSMQANVEAYVWLCRLAGKQWKYLKFDMAPSGKTLLLSAKLENNCIDTTRNTLVIKNLKELKASR